MMTEEDLSEQLWGVKNRAQAKAIAERAIADAQVRECLMELFFSDDLRTCQKASWPVTLITDTHPSLLNEYLPQMIERLDDAQHDALIRNTVRSWQTMHIPEDYEGLVYDLCFNYLADPAYAIAIRVFSMTVCTKIALRHEGLAEELISVIEEHLPYGSTGFQNRGAKMLIQLKDAIG